MSERDGLYLGVDVGTGSARAALFDAKGRLQGLGVQPIIIWRPQTDFVEQSSDDIWESCCAAVKQALAAASARAEQIRGIGFDATCSLVALDAQDRPVTVSPTERDEQNVVVWMDHRAIAQADRINETKHGVLEYVGGVISPEMQSPKLLWLKQNSPQTWQRTARFFDLPDFLTYRATGSDTRSLCSTVCKWTYQGHLEANDGESIGRWDDSFWQQIDLGQFVDEAYQRIGTRIRPMGEPVGEGLTAVAADQLGLLAGTPVGVSIIDAHAGGLGLLGAKLDEKQTDPRSFESRLALIGGTSSCHMVAAKERHFVPGVWGPYYSAMIPGMWLAEGGQSATGSLIDHVVFGHRATGELNDEAEQSGQTVYQLLNQRLRMLAKNEPFRARLTNQLHVLPFFNGNRSPRADPTLRGCISGLKLADDADELALQYLATVQAIAHGTRHIISAMNEQGYCIDTIFMCGGGTKNPIFIQEHADITGCQVILPQEPEAVLLGSAILGAVAAGDFDSVPAAMAALSAVGERIAPATGEVAQYHQAKHTVFQRMYDDQLAYRELMGGR